MSATFELCNKLIDSYERTGRLAEKKDTLLEKIDVYFAADRLSIEEYNILIERLS